MEKKLIYDIQDKPRFGQLLVLALQQVLAILAATVAVPAIIGLPTQIPYAFAESGAVAKTIQVTSIATALILGIVTNAILSKVEKGKEKKTEVSEE